MRAYGKYVLVEPFKREEVHASGLILSKSEEEGEYEAGRGKVLSAGAEVPNIKDNDVIRFKAHHENVIEEGKWIIGLDSIIAIE